MKKQSVISSILWLTIAEIFFNFSGYLIHSSLGRMLGPADYGRYALIVNLTTTVIMLIGNGIPTAMSKYLSGVFETTPDLVLVIKKQAAFLQAVLIGSVTAVFYLSAPLIAALLNDPTLVPLLHISTLIIPSYAAASFYLYYYIGIHRFNIQSTMKIIRSFARIIFVIGMAYLWKVTGSVASYILSPATVFIAAWFIDRLWVDKNFPTETEKTFDWKKLLDYAWPVTLFMLFYQILTSLDLYMVKSLLGSDKITGIYNASLTVSQIPYYLFYALTLVMLPSISRTTSQGNHEQARKIIRQTFRMMLMVLIPTAIFMMAYASPLIELFFGRQFADATLPMRILTPGMILLTIFYVMSFSLNGAGKVMVPMWISLAGMLLNGVLNYSLVTRFGVIGSATATAITSTFITTIILLYAYGYFKSLMRVVPFLKFILAGIITAIAAYFMPPQKWLFILWGLVLAGVFVGSLAAMGEFTKDDIDLFRRMLFSRKKKASPVPVEDAN